MSSQPAKPQNADGADGHVVHLPQPFKFEVGDDFDFLRRGAIKTVWYWLFRCAASVVLAVVNTLCWGMCVRGRKNLRGLHGGAVVVCNHVHVMDCTFIDAVFPLRRMYYGSLETNFKIPLARHFQRWLGDVPVPLKPHSMRRYMDSMHDALAHGARVCIYPEGVLLPYYKGIRDFKSGAFRLAADAQCPVIPLVITYRRPAPTPLFGGRQPVTVNVLPPIYPDAEQAPRNAAQRLQELCKLRMEEFFEQHNFKRPENKQPEGK